MKDNWADHGGCYLQHTTKPNGNHGEKDKHRQEQRARKQLRSRGGVVKGVVGERLWLVGTHSEFICTAGVKAGLCPVGNQLDRDRQAVNFELCALSDSPLLKYIELKRWTPWWSTITSLSFSSPCHLFQEMNPCGKNDREEGGISLPVNANNWPVCLWARPDVSGRASGFQCQRGPGLWSLDVTLNLPWLKIRGPATPAVQSWYKQLHASYAEILLKQLYGYPMQNTFICLVSTIMCL